MAKSKATANTQNTIPAIMPLLGLAQLAATQYPGDVDDPEAMEQHKQDLWLLNKDILANPDSYQVGQQVMVYDTLNTSTSNAPVVVPPVTPVDNGPEFAPVDNGPDNSKSSSKVSG